MEKVVRLSSTIDQYNLKSRIYYSISPDEIDELHYYFDEVSGDDRGLD